MSADWTKHLLERWQDIHPDLELDPYLVTVRLSRAAVHVANRQEAVFAKFGLNRGEVGVLSALRTADPDDSPNPTKLFKGLMISSAGMTSRLDRLEERGLIRRRPDRADRRGVRIELTSAGRRLVDKAVAANTVADAIMLEMFTDKEARRLSELLHKLLAGLEPLPGTEPVPH